MNKRDPMGFHSSTSRALICPTCETEQALTATGICSQCEVLMRFGQKLSPQYWTYSPDIVFEFRLAARLLDLGFYGLLWMALMPKETLTYLTFLQIVPFILLC